MGGPGRSGSRPEPRSRRRRRRHGDGRQGGRQERGGGPATRGGARTRRSGAVPAERAPPAPATTPWCPRRRARGRGHRSRPRATNPTVRALLETCAASRPTPATDQGDPRSRTPRRATEPGDRQPAGDVGRRPPAPRRRRRPGGLRQRGGERGVRADGARARSSARPHSSSTRVCRRRSPPHERHEHGDEGRSSWPGHQLADGVEDRAGTGQGDDRRRWPHAGRGGRELAPASAYRPVDAHRLATSRAARTPSTTREQDPVAPSAKADQQPGPRHLHAHGVRVAVGRRGRAPRGWAGCWSARGRRPRRARTGARASPRDRPSSDDPVPR